MNWGRIKAYDYGVLGLFVLTIIGVSLAWYSFAGFGAGSGWNVGLGVWAFIWALIAVLVVLVKTVLPANAALPSWYKEGWAIMVLGGLMTLFALIRVIDVPGPGLLTEGVGRGAGGFITLIAGLLMAGCGYMMFRDKSGAYAGAGAFKLPGMGAQTPPAGYTPPPGYPPRPGAPPAAGSFCSNCGAGLAPEDAACRACGKPV